MMRRATTYDWVGDPVPGRFHILHSPSGRGEMLDLEKWYPRMLARAACRDDSDLVRLMHISRQTLSRRKQSGQRLTPLETDRLAMLTRVYNAALAYYEGDRVSAVTWLKHPAPALGQETPLEHSDTTPGAEVVLELLGKIRPR